MEMQLNLNFHATVMFTVTAGFVMEFGFVRIGRLVLFRLKWHFTSTVQ